MDDYIQAILECLKLGKEAGIITDITVNTDDSPPEIWVSIMEKEYLVNIQDFTIQSEDE